MSAFLDFCLEMVGFMALRLPLVQVPVPIICNALSLEGLMRPGT